MNDTYRILAENVTISNNTHKTGLNNNDLIIGPSGSGKTRGYVIPNLLKPNESMIIADTKGNLRTMLEPQLKKQGFHVLDLNFKDLDNSLLGYNPLAFVKKNGSVYGSEYSEQDIISISEALCPVRTDRDPYWEESAQNYIQCLISYVLNCLPDNEKNINSVIRLSEQIGTDEFNEMMEEEIDINPNSLLAKRYRQIRSNQGAEKTDACIISFVYRALSCLSSAEMLDFSTNRKNIDIKRIGREKTILFLEISDVDRSKDTLVNLFYAQAFKLLLEEADQQLPNCRLNIPVRFILDDFASNTIIPNFDNLISVIRSRDISVSLIIQSISQLENLYGSYASKTIINNCDNILYLGGTDIQTAQYFGIKLNKPPYTVLNLPLNDAYLFTRGKVPLKVQKYLLEHHADFQNYPEKEHTSNPLLQKNRNMDWNRKENTI